jgi:hypothetical protein
MSVYSDAFFNYLNQWVSEGWQFNVMTREKDLRKAKSLKRKAKSLWPETFLPINMLYLARILFQSFFLGVRGIAFSFLLSAFCFQPSAFSLQLFYDGI